MKNRWWLAGSCLLILTAVFVTVKVYAIMGTPKPRPADTVSADLVPEPRENREQQVVSYGGQSKSAPVIPSRSGLAEDPPQEGMPGEGDRYPDIQPDDTQTDFPGQDEMNQQEPYQIVPPEDDYQDSLPPEEDLPVE